MKTNALTFDPLLQSLNNWFRPALQPQPKMMSTCVELRKCLCPPPPFQLAASTLMQRHKLCCFLFVPIGLRSLELSQQPQHWDCCFSQCDSIIQEARVALNCLVTIQLAWVARMMSRRAALLLSEKSSIQKHPFAMVL